LGCVLFYSDGKRTTVDVPDGSPAVDWKSVEVKLGVDNVVASVTRISGALVSEVHLGANRMPGAAAELFANDFRLVLQVLDDRPEGVVGVVGACTASGLTRSFCETPQ
jgi:hypothetical protein